MNRLRDAWEVFRGRRIAAPIAPVPFVGVRYWIDDDDGPPRLLREGEEMIVRYSEGAVTVHVGGMWALSSPWSVRLRFDPRPA